MSRYFDKYGFRFLLVMLITSAFVFRLSFFIFGLRHMPVSTDEAWPALMGLHVLKGEFPVFYWGQNYMGSLQAFFDAFMFMLFGINTFAARIYPLFFSFIYLAAACLLARRVYNRNTAFTTLSLLVIPIPYLTMAGILSVPPEYLALTAMGSCALLLLADITLRQNIQKLPLKRLLLLGFLLGFMFWLHIVAISFIVVALLFIFLRDKLFFIRPAFLGTVACFFIGGLPFWWFNFTHTFVTFTDMAGTGDWRSARELCRALFGISLHFMTGMKVMLYGDSSRFVSLPFFMAVTLGIIWCLAIILVIWKHFRGMLKWLKFYPTGADGTAILLALAVLTLYLFCRSERSSWSDVRFILPIMSVLPVLLASGLEHIRHKSRIAFVVLLVFIIMAQAWGNILLAHAWGNADVVGRKLELPDTTPLHRFLDEHGITRAYAHYWISYRITFESRERLICAEPFNERFPGRPAQYLDEVHSAANVAFITHPTLRFVPDFEEHLLAIGGTYKKEQAGDFTVFYDIVPPCGKTNHASGVINLCEIDLAYLQISTESNREMTSKMTDGDLKTQWSSGAPQSAGQSLLIDLGSMEKICKIRFDLTGVECDAPNGYLLEVSGDGREWRKVYESGAVAESFFWENGQPWMFVGNNFYTAAFAPIEGKYIRMTLTAGHAKFWWSITELRIFGPDSGTAK